MISKALIILGSFFTVLFTSYCVHNQNGQRGVSSGVDSVVSREQVTKNTSIGEWRIDLEKPIHPEQSKIIQNISYRCRGEKSFKNIPDPTMQLPLATFHDSIYPMNVYPLVSDPTSWNKFVGTRTYRNHKAATRVQDLNSVVFIKFLPWAVEVDFSSNDPKVLEETGELKQIVLDLQLLCPH